MENITCKAFQAVVDKKLEFCSSCGEWLGLKIEDLEDTNSPNDNKFEKRTRIPQIDVTIVVTTIYLLLKLVKSVGFF